MRLIVPICLLFATLPGCAALEPRAADPLPVQVGKGLLYVPASVGVGVLLLATATVEGEVDRRSEQVRIDQDRAARDSELDRGLFR